MKMRKNRSRQHPHTETVRKVVHECYCPNGHSLISDLAQFNGHDGITVKLRGKGQEGLLSLSAVIGDKSRTFFDFQRNEGEIIDILCPTCDAPLPLYNLCGCDAWLVSLFTTPQADFANSIGICQRIGCLHSDILSNRDLRLYSRNGFY